MAVEQRRRCGFRKAGGLYLVGEPRGVPCTKLPFPIHTCPWCGAGIKVTRSLRMIKASTLLHHLSECKSACPMQGDCPLEVPTRLDKVGLLGVGVKYYPTPEDFNREAAHLGVCKRIPRLPRGFEVGKTWVFLSHPKACIETLSAPPDINEPLGPAVNPKPTVIVDEKGNFPPKDEADQLFREVPGIFKVFQPKLEYVSDGTEDPKKIERMEKLGADIVKVPPDDPDHH